MPQISPALGDKVSFMLTLPATDVTVRTPVAVMGTINNLHRPEWVAVDIASKPYHIRIELPMSDLEWRTNDDTWIIKQPKLEKPKCPEREYVKE